MTKVGNMSRVRCMWIEHRAEKAFTKIQKEAYEYKLSLSNEDIWGIAQAISSKAFDNDPYNERGVLDKGIDYCIERFFYLADNEGMIRACKFIKLNPHKTFGVINCRYLYPELHNLCRA